MTVNGVTTFGSPILLQSGVDNYHDLDEEFGLAAQSRWGDYSTISVDPSNPAYFWVITMYAAGTDPDFGEGIWSTQITGLLTALQLSIARSGNNVMVSWPALSGYELLTATNLAPPVAWSNFTGTIQTNGVQAYVLAPVSGGQQYFRLFHP